MNLPKVGLLIFISLISVLTLKAQQKAFDELEYTKKLSNYRANLLLDNADKVDELFKIWRKWEKLEPNPDTLRSQFERVLNYKTFRFSKVHDVVWEMYEEGVNSKWLNSITDKDISKFTEFYEIRQSINNDIFEVSPPFRFKNIKGIIDELKFYDLHQGDRLAQIYSGDGMFSIFLGLTDLDLDITVHAKFKMDINDISQNLAAYQNYINQPGYSIVKGTKKSINIGYKVDKVLYRYGFHHLSDNNEIIESIKNALEPGGSIYILEYLDKRCKAFIPADELEGVFAKYGLVLIKERMTENAVQQEYKFK